MDSVAIISARHILFTIGIILLIGTLGSLAAQRFKIPDVVIFLLAGLLCGPELAGIITVQADSTLNQLVLIFGSSYILFDGGASVRLKIIREVWITVLVISTVGLLITALLTSFCAVELFGIPLLTALLLGCTIASTDPATLIPVFTQIRIKERVAQTVISESACNDAMGAIITFSIMGLVCGSKGTFSLLTTVTDLIGAASIGIITGALLGYLAALLIAHERYGFLQEYAPLVTLMAVLGSYMTAEGFHASGFMSVFVFGIVIGNKELVGFAMNSREGEKLEDFILTTSLMMRMFIFILLGSQVDLKLIGDHLGSGVLLVLIFMLVIRPITVFCCALPDRRAGWSLKEMLFMSWTRETGVIPGALAGMMLAMKIPGSDTIAAITFITILMTITIQGTTTGWMAGKLGLKMEDR